MSYVPEENMYMNKYFRAADLEGGVSKITFLDFWEVML